MLNKFVLHQKVLNTLAVTLVLAVCNFVHAQVQFTDVTDLSGVGNGNRRHFGSTWSDYNNDGLLDLYVVNGGSEPNRNDAINTLYRNNGDGTFTDVTEETGTGDPWVAMRNIWADYDNDGDLDLYSHNFLQSTLYQNNGNVFTDVNDSSGAGVQMVGGTGGAWGDYDNDGLLDLHLTGFPGQNALLHNNGNGTFSDLQAISGLPVDADGMGNAWGDFNNDGFLDLAIAAVTSRDTAILYMNNGDGTFTDITDSAGIILDFGASTSAVAWGDYDNDGWLDLIITEVILGSEKVVRNKIYLFKNKGDGTFEEVSATAGLISPATAIEFWDATWGDYDNDGDIDLYIGVNGPNIFYRNNGNGTFSDIAPELGLDMQFEGKGVIWGDYDNDGDLDLYVVQRSRGGEGLIPNRLLRNDGGLNGWLQIKLVGVTSNRDGIGARISVTSSGVVQIREVNGGTGFFSQNTPIQQFGLGSVAMIDEIRIEWPSGVVDRLFDVSANTRLTVVETNNGGGNPNDPLALSSILPNTLTIGETRDVTVTGTGFQDGASMKICFDGAVMINQVAFIDSTTLIANVTVPNGIQQTSCGAKITNPDGEVSNILNRAVTISN